MDYLVLLKLVAPETVVVLTSLVVLAFDLGVMRGKPLASRMQTGAVITSIGGLVAILSMITTSVSVNFENGILVINPVTQFIKSVLLILTIATALISIPSKFTEHVGEYFNLLLLSTVGMMFMVSSDHILVIFIALEMTSLSLYILTAFNKRNVRSAEAALKYFLFGGMSAAVTLYGLSLIYGLADAATLPEIAAGVAGKTVDPLFLVGMLMVLAGLGFKIAAVPFHLWAPDAYDGAPTPVAALIASGSKVAGFFLLAKVTIIGFAGAGGSAAYQGFVNGWIPVLALFSILSMFLGNLAAVMQSNVKRLLAYSAIAHAGYALLAVMGNSEQGVAALLYYAITYAITAIGAFAVVSLVENENGVAKFEHFVGLSKRSPLAATCMFVFILSLAGIPPLAGFFGKFYVFVAAVSSDQENLSLLWLIIFAIAMSAVSLYYYLMVLKQIYVTDVPNDLPALKAPIAVRFVLVILAFAVALLGFAPEIVLSRL